MYRAGVAALEYGAFGERANTALNIGGVASLIPKKYRFDLKRAKELYKTADNIVSMVKRKYPSRGGGGKRRKSGRRPRRRSKRGRGNYKARFRTEIGERVGTSNCKQTLTGLSDPPVGLAPTTLLAYDLTSIGTRSAENINRRDRDVVNLRGIKMAWHAFTNQTPTSTFPTYLNMAIVVDKSDEGLGLLQNDFWRDYGENDARQRNFQDATRFERCTLSINSDKFQVLTKKRFALNQTDIITQSGLRNVTRRSYIRVNRQIRFADGNTGSPIHGKMYAIFWMENYDEQIVDGQPIGGIFFRSSAYWRETKN